MLLDDVQRAYYHVCFQRDYRSKKETAFQGWFNILASHALGPDFESVQAAGPKGDFKADGRQLSTKTIFQCYAPKTINISNLNAKIRDDYAGAKDAWDEMKRWVLVLGANEGLPPESSQLLDELRQTNPDIAIEVWMEPQLVPFLSQLDLPAMENLFGFSPSQSGINALVLEDILPILRYLEQQSPIPGQEPISPPSVEKLQKNELSDDTMMLLKVGRRKEALVASYFATSVNVEMGEQIAEAFRRRYIELKLDGHPPDIIFWHLQHYAGASGLPKQQSAGLAVLSYFFERCDIFEDPTMQDA